MPPTRHPHPPLPLVRVDTRDVQAADQLQDGQRVRQRDVHDRRHVRHQEAAEIRAHRHQNDDVQTRDGRGAQRRDTAGEQLYA